MHQQLVLYYQYYTVHSIYWKGYEYVKWCAVLCPRAPFTPPQHLSPLLCAPPPPRAPNAPSSSLHPSRSGTMRQLSHFLRWTDAPRSSLSNTSTLWVRGSLFSSSLLRNSRSTTAVSAHSPDQLKPLLNLRFAFIFGIPVDAQHTLYPSPTAYPRRSCGLTQQTSHRHWVGLFTSRENHLFSQAAIRASHQCNHLQLGNVHSLATLDHQYLTTTPRAPRPCHSVPCTLYHPPHHSRHIDDASLPHQAHAQDDSFSTPSVRKGQVTGIFNIRIECFQSTNGIPNEFRGFHTWNDAHQYLHSEWPSWFRTRAI